LIIDNPITDRREIIENGILVDFTSRAHIEQSQWEWASRVPKWGYYPIEPSPTVEAAPAGLLPDKAA
jgi:hypothetical protein